MMGLPFTQNITANGNYPIDGRPSGRNTMTPTFMAAGTWGGGTLKMQAGFVNAAGVTTWVDIANASLTANGHAAVPVKANYYRFVLSGATSPNLDAWFG